MQSPAFTVVLTAALVVALALSVTQEGQGIKDIVAAVIAARLVRSSVFFSKPYSEFRSIT